MSQKVIDMYEKFGKSGVFIVVLVESIRNLFGKNRGMLSGWHSPIAPEIMKGFVGKSIRVISFENEHSVRAKTKRKESMELDEDIYPLV